MRTTILKQIDTLNTLDNTEQSFHICCRSFEHFLENAPFPSFEEQQLIQQLFKKFQNQPFFDSLSASCQQFYPSMMKVDSFSSTQEDDYFSKRFCFSFYPSDLISVESIHDNLAFIYDNVFTHLKEKDSVADFYCISEQGFFYLYLFSTDSEQLKLICKTVNTFHNEIQPFLQNNTVHTVSTVSEDYYLKLFEQLYLTEKLVSQKYIQKLSREKKLKI